MKKNRLRKLLDDLNREISDVDVDKTELRESLGTLQRQIDKSIRQLDDSNPEPLDHESLWRRVTASMEAFETTHPKLTAIMGDILNALARYRV